MPLGAVTVSNNLVFTTLYSGVLIALNRATGAIVYQHKLPTSANAPIAIAGNAILVPAGGPHFYGQGGLTTAGRLHDSLTSTRPVSCLVPPPQGVARD